MINSISPLGREEKIKTDVLHISLLHGDDGVFVARGT
jgi:hypothetical protein